MRRASDVVQSPCGQQQKGSSEDVLAAINMSDTQPIPAEDAQGSAMLSPQTTMPSPDRPDGSGECRSCLPPAGVHVPVGTHHMLQLC
jgi:hypothetical protein